MLFPEKKRIPASFAYMGAEKPAHQAQAAAKEAPRDCERAVLAYTLGSGV
jgi:hypothetical protein